MFPDPPWGAVRNELNRGATGEQQRAVYQVMVSRVTFVIGGWEGTSDSDVIVFNLVLPPFIVISTAAHVMWNIL